MPGNEATPLAGEMAGIWDTCGEDLATNAFWNFAQPNRCEIDSNSEINKLTSPDGNFFQELKHHESQTKHCKVKEGVKKGYIKLF